MTTRIVSRGDIEFDASTGRLIANYEIADGENSHLVATTKWVTTAVNNLIGGAPGTLDTLNELAAAIGDDPDFYTNITTIGGNAVIRSGDTMTGPLILSRDPVDALEAVTRQWTIAQLNAQTTDVIEEGSTNRYYLDDRARGAISVALDNTLANPVGYVRSDGVITYNPSTTVLVEGNKLFYTDTRARDSLSYTTGVANYNPSTGQITIPRNTSQISEDPQSSVTSGTMYFTNARARGAISVQGPLTYDAGAGTVGVPDSGVTAGSYEYADITVDRYGNVSSAVSSSRITTTGTTPNLTVNLFPTGTGTVELHGSTNVTGNLYASGNITAGGNITLGDAPTDTITLAAEVNSDILPLTTDTYNIGSTNNRWASTYAKTTINNKQIVISDIDPTVNTSNYVLTCTTTDAISTQLTIVGTTKITIPTESSASFEIKFVGANSTQRYASVIKGLVINVSGVTSLVGANSKEIIATTSPDLNTVVALSGNTLTISATGLASTTIKWTAFASITTVTF